MTFTPSIDQLTQLNQTTFKNTFAAFVAENKPPALVAGLMLDGELSCVFSHGIENTHLSAPGDIAFRIASMSKCFGAAAVLKLRDAGALELEDPVSKHLQSLRNSEWDRITLFHLLTMQSGLPFDNAWGDRLLGWSNQQFAELLQSPLLFAAAAGSEYHYSNLGYMILGSIIGTVTGKSTLDYIEHEFFKPLNMSNTSWNPIQDKWVAGFTRHKEALIHEPVTRTEFDGAIFGGIWSTLNDLVLWIRFLVDDTDPDHKNTFNEILSIDSRNLLQSSQVRAPFILGSLEQSFYGLGLANNLGELSVTTAHSGGLPGYGSHFRWSRELNCGIIALSNGTYMPVTTPCRAILDRVITNLFYTKKPLSNLLQHRAGELLALLKTWDDKQAADCFSSNFFLDTPVSEFLGKLSTLSGKLHGGDSSPLIIPDRGFKARLIINNEEALILTLAPAEGGKIQEVEFLAN